MSQYSEYQMELLDRVRNFLEAMSALSMKDGVYLQASSNERPCFIVEDADGHTLVWVETSCVEFFYNVRPNVAMIPRGYVGSLEGATVEVAH